MSITLEEFNDLAFSEAKEVLTRCCGSSQWVKKMIEARPFKSIEALYEEAQKIWQSLTREDWLEAFEQHPQIGDLSSLKAKFSHTKEWASDEQKGTDSASEQTLMDLATYNKDYLNKFGYIFIICASGKSAMEMLDALKTRIENEPLKELQIAADQQLKITIIRLKKMLL